MSTTLLDAGALRDEIRATYRDVALSPGGEYHFETGRALAERLGYPHEWLDAVAGRGAGLVRRRRATSSTSPGSGRARRSWTSGRAPAPTRASPPTWPARAGRSSAST